MKEKMAIKCPEIEKSRQEELFFDDWLNTKEAARYLSTSESQLRNLTSNGRIPFYKFGRSNKYKRSELERVLQENPRGVRNDN